MLKKFILIIIPCFLIIFTTSANERNTTLSLEVGKDEQGNTNSMLSADLTLNKKMHVFFGVGNSKTPSGNDVIDNNLAFVGLSNRFTQDWKLTGMIEYSGLKDAFTMVSTSAAMRYSHPNVFVELVPAFRRIRLTTLGNRQLIVNSTALGVKSGVYLGDHFRLSGSAYSYNYSSDVSKLASFNSIRFFDFKTLFLSSGLLKESYNIETGLDFNSFSISAGKNHSVSAIDFTDSDYGYLVLDYFFSDAWSMSVLAGKYEDIPEDENNFSSLRVNYSF